MIMIKWLLQWKEKIYITKEAYQRANGMEMTMIGKSLCLLWIVHFCFSKFLHVHDSIVNFILCYA
jgi:hypothetical protein